MKSNRVRRPLSSPEAALWPLLSVLFAFSAVAAPVPPGQLGCEAPALEGLEWVKGDPVKIQKDAVYVVEFWATWCGPCIKGIPHLTELQHEYKDQGVTIIGVSNETNGKVPPFVEKQGKKMDYTVAIDAAGKASEGYMKAFGQNGIPHAFVIDQGGRVAWHGHPMTMDEPLKQIVAGTYNLEKAKTQMAEEKQQQERARAEYQRKQEALEKRVAEIGSQLEADPTNAGLWAARAEACLGASFSTDLSYRPSAVVQAVQDFQKALELDPSDPHNAAEHLAFFGAWQDQSDTRIEKLRAFTRAYPDSIRVPFAMYSLYYDAYEKGEKNQALKYLTVADTRGLEGRFGNALRDLRSRLEKELADAPTGPTR